MRHALTSLITALVVTALGATTAGAAPGVSFRIGGGKVLNHGGLATAGVELGIPIVPVSFRGDADLTSPGNDGRRWNFLAGAAYSLGLPLVHPYVVAGMGRYHAGEDDARTGMNLGAGVRAGVAGLGAFGEIRWHEPLSATALTVGVTF